ncbi:MAG: acyl-CoA synthetase [Stappiaceae bacterium]
MTVPEKLNLARYCLERSARLTPDKTALVVYDQVDHVAERWCYRDIESAVLGVAGALKSSDIPAGSQVLLRIGNSSMFPFVFLGAISAGMVPVPTSSMLTERECNYVFLDSQAAAIIHDGKTSLPTDIGSSIVLGPDDIEQMIAAPAGDYADTGANDPAFLVYTSGTSGAPKGVLHAHRSLFGRRPMYRSWYGISDQDVLLHAGAFNWTYTLGVGLMDPWVNGATSVVYSGPNKPEIWADLIERCGATLFAAVPSLYRRILKYSALDRTSFPKLRHGLTAGEALPVALYNEWLKRTGRPLFEALGMSEISTYISSSPEVAVRPGSPGKPQIGRKIAILPPDNNDLAPLPVGESGLLAVHKSDPGMMIGYWRLPEETAAAFRGPWFLTGDSGHLDEDGYVWFGGRTDDVMNASGYRVAPQEVEEVIGLAPGVSEVAVAQVQTADGVDLISAYIVASVPENTDAAPIEQWCAARLAKYKRPRQYRFVADLPRTRSGKILRRKLNELD